MPIHPGCENPSGKLRVVYFDDEPRHRYMHCHDCGEFLFLEILDERETVPPHPDNCLCCNAPKN